MIPRRCDHSHGSETDVAVPGHHDLEGRWTRCRAKPGTGRVSGQERPTAGRADRRDDATKDASAMPTPSVTTIATCDEVMCEICHCSGEGCDGTVCHGLDAD